MHMGILSACVSMHYVFAWCAKRSKKGIRSLGLESHTIFSLQVAARN